MKQGFVGEAVGEGNSPAATCLCIKPGKKITKAGLDHINKSVYLGTITDRSLTSLENELAAFIHQQARAGIDCILTAGATLHVDQMRFYRSTEADKKQPGLLAKLAKMCRKLPYSAKYTTLL